MPQPSCDRCRYYAHNPYLVCALHPSGPESRPCRDFEAAPADQPTSNQAWYYPASWLPLAYRRADDNWTAFWTAEEGPPETH